MEKFIGLNNLGKKKQFEIKGYIKCSLNEYLETTLEEIHKKVGSPRADIIRLALYQYIRINFPEFLK